MDPVQVDICKWARLVLFEGATRRIERTTRNWIISQGTEAKSYNTTVVPPLAQHHTTRS